MARNERRVITVVGLGALGSHLIEFGRNLPVEFIGIDFDRVETKNLQSQFHSKMGVGRNKAQSIQQAMKGLYGMNVKGVPHKLTEQNTDALLAGSDVVVDCLDNAASRHIVQTFVREMDIPCLHGALAADGQFGSVLWDEMFRIDSEDVEGQATCEGGEFLWFIVEVAATMVQVLQAYLNEGKKLNFHIHPYRKLQI